MKSWNELSRAWRWAWTSALIFLVIGIILILFAMNNPSGSSGFSILLDLSLGLLIFILLGFLIGLLWGFVTNKKVSLWKSFFIGLLLGIIVFIGSLNIFGYNLFTLIYDKIFLIFVSIQNCEGESCMIPEILVPFVFALLFLIIGIIINKFISKKTT
ncbi:MAG: hypothetical protein AABX17_01630 [Nanoarchaeota archaeon]